jgi:hypothetical protein
MQIGVDSFGAVISDPSTGLSISPVQRLENLLEEIVLADEVDLDVFGVGEHHRKEFVDSAPTVILAAAATRTKDIRLSSAMTVLSAADPVHVFQEFATLDVISHGRAEIVAGRGSSIEAFPLFGLDLADYDSLFSEKLDLLLQIRKQTHIHWTGQHRPTLTGQAIYPRPLQNPLPIWVGVGGTPPSFVRAGTLGLPLMVAIIGGEFKRFRPLSSFTAKGVAVPATPLTNSESGFTQSAFWATQPSRLRKIFIPATRTHLPRSARNEAGRPPHELSLMLYADLPVPCLSATLKPSRTKYFT